MTLENKHHRLRDSYRVAHPSADSHPGVTWSPVQSFYESTTTRPEPQDRIDFVFYRGDKLAVIDSVVHMEGNRHSEGHRDADKYRQYRYNDWPSDHAAVITTFGVRAAPSTC